MVAQCSSDTIESPTSRIRRIVCDVYWSLATAFLSPAAIPVFSPHQSQFLWRAFERLPATFAFADTRHSAHMSELRIDGDGHGGDNTLRRELLEMHEMRWCLERIASAIGTAWLASMAMTSTPVARELRQLIPA
jgi:hypothetical protein